MAREADIRVCNFFYWVMYATGGNQTPGVVLETTTLWSSEDPTVERHWKHNFEEKKQKHSS